VPGTRNVSSPYFGDWNTASNWVGGIVPNGIGKIAIFDNTVSSATAAIINVPVMLGVLNIASSSRIDITGVDQGMLTMPSNQHREHRSDLCLRGTLDKLNLPLSFNRPTAISVARGSTLELGNPVNLNGQTVTGSWQPRVNAPLLRGSLRRVPAGYAITRSEYGTPRTGAPGHRHQKCCVAENRGPYRRLQTLTQTLP